MIFQTVAQNILDQLRTADNYIKTSANNDVKTVSLHRVDFPTSPSCSIAVFPYSTRRFTVVNIGMIVDQVEL